MNFLTWLAALIPFVLFNRVCGGGMSKVTYNWPGRALYWVSGALGWLTGALVNPFAGVSLGFGFLIWRAPGWGLMFDLGERDEQSANDPRHNDPLMKFLYFIGRNDYGAFFFRHAIFLVPFFAATYTEWYLALLIVPMSITLLLGYEFGKYAKRRHGYPEIQFGELFGGAMWWLWSLVLFGLTSKWERTPIAMLFKEVSSYAKFL